MKKILFVCTGNICRSPSAEAVFRHVVAARGQQALYQADSAGTHGYHIGEAPDSRSIKAAAARGIDMGDLVARKVSKQDFTDFDYVIALDKGHYDILERLKPTDSKAALTLFLDYAEGRKGQDVPDPYYGEAQGFEHVLDLLEEGVDGLLTDLSGSKT